MRKAALLLASLTFMFFVRAEGQNYAPDLGLVPTGSFQRYRVESVNLQNRNDVIRIPLFSLPQKGKLKLSYSIILNAVDWRGTNYCYNDNIYCQFTYVTEPGVPLIPSPGAGAWVYEDQGFWPGVKVSNSMRDSNGYLHFNATYSVTDSTNATHALYYDQDRPSQLRSVDGSKLLYVSNSGTPYLYPSAPTTGDTLLDQDGTKYSSTLQQDQNGTSYISNARQDVSGNTIWTDNSKTYDSGGRQFIAADKLFWQQTSADVSGCPNLTSQGSFQPATSSYSWQVPGSNGNVTYLLCFAKVNVHTNFWDHGGQDYQGDVSAGGCGDGDGTACNYSQIFSESVSQAPMLQSVVLPDKTYWSFIYDSADPSDTNAIAYGNLTKLIYPDGGSVSYQYEKGYGCDWPSDVQQFAGSIGWNGFRLKSRTENDAQGHSYTWTYFDGGMTDPNGNDTLVDFQIDPHSPCRSGIENRRRAYQGNRTNGTLLRDTQTALLPTSVPYAAYSAAFDGYATQVATGIRQWVDGQEASSATPFYKGSFQAVAYDCTLYNVGTQPSCSAGPPVGMSFGQSGGSSLAPGFGQSALKQNLVTYKWESDGDYWNSNILNTPTTIQVSDGSGHQSSLTTTNYDENSSKRGLPTSMVRWNNLGSDTQTSTVWTGTGMIDHVIDGNHHSTTYSYDNTGIFPYQVTNALGHTDSYWRDPNTGAVTQHQDQNGNNNYFTYEAGGRLTSYWNDIVAPNSAVHGGIDYCYTVPSATGGNQTLPSGCSGGSGTSVIAGTHLDGSSTLRQETDFDGLGRPTGTSTFIGAGKTNEKLLTYDGLDNIVSESLPFDSTSPPTGNFTRTFDALGRQLILVQPDNSIVQTCYDDLPLDSRLTVCNSRVGAQSSGLWVDSADEAGHHKQTISDAAGRLTQVAELGTTSAPMSAITSYSYDPLDNLTGVDQAGVSGESARIRSFSYDALSRLITSDNPETGAICYGLKDGAGKCVNGYDANGNLLYKTDARARVTQFGYDALNRLTSKTFSDQTPSVCLTYDTAPNGIRKLATEQTQNGSCDVATLASSAIRTQRSILSYDEEGRITGEQSCVLGVCTPSNLSYTFDYAGNPTSLVDASGTKFSYSYDAAGRLGSLSSSQADGTHPANMLTGMVYGPMGLSSAALGNLLEEAYTYDNRGRPDTFSVGVSGLNNSIYSYKIRTANGGAGSGYAANSNVSDVTDAVMGTWHYDYDNLNRLKAASSAHLSLGWTFDSFGNLKTQSTSPGTVDGSGSSAIKSFTYSGSNNRPDGFEFDDSGNLLNEGRPPFGASANQWDAESRLISPDNGTTRYEYDAEGRRVAKVVGNSATIYVYDNSGHAINELKANVTPTGPAGFTYCASENPQNTAVCSFSGPATVAYGYGGSFYYANKTDGTPCTDQVLGNPTPGIYKACFYQPQGTSIPTGPTGYIYCAPEGGTCNFTGTARVAFGIEGHFWYDSYTNGTACTAAVHFDPAPGVNKSCFYSLQNGGLPAGPPGYIFCAAEAETCNFSHYSQIAFGANGHFNYLPSNAGSISCSDDTFGDPLMYVTKACFYSPTNGSMPVGPAGTTYCAHEGETCYFAGTATIWYGYAGRFVSSTQTGGVACSDALGDPYGGLVKDCFYQPMSGNQLQGPPGYIYCAHEGSMCNFEGYGRVAYTSPSSPSNYQYTPNIGSLPCGQLGNSGSNGECFYSASNGTPPVGPEGYIYCAKENETCNFSGVAKVVYGYNGAFTAPIQTAGPVACNDNLGDPAGGLIKACFYAPAVAVTRSEIYAGSRHLATYENGGTYFVHSDWLGTERARTDYQGLLCQTTTTLPFGDALTLPATGLQSAGSCNPSTRFFTGKEGDAESGLDYFGARYYGSSMGRFMSPDPLLNSGRPDNPQTWNRYTYGLNNPLRNTDPTGLYTCSGDKKQCSGFADALSAAKSALGGLKKGSADYNNLNSAINAYGKAGVDNGVHVGFGATSGAGNTTVGVLADANGNKITTADNPTGQNINVTIDPSKNGSLNQEAITVGHEGSHVADGTALVGALPSNLAGSDAVLGGPLNMTSYQTEMKAYGVSAAIAQGMGLGTLTIGNGNVIWNSSWGAVDAMTLRNQGIQHELADPKGLYNVTPDNQGKKLIQ